MLRKYIYFFITERERAKREGDQQADSYKAGILESGFVNSRAEFRMIRGDCDGFQVVRRLKGVLGVSLSCVEFGSSGDQQFDIGVQTKTTRSAGLESKGRIMNKRD